MKISTQQPMRSAEIELVEQVNTNTEGLADEVTARTNADTTLGNAITAETNRATQAETTLGNAITAETNRAKQAEINIQNTVTTLGDNINNLEAMFPVKTDDIGNLQVTESKLANSAVTENKISDLQVTNAKLAADAVSTDKVQNGAITAAKLDQDVQDKLTLIESFPMLTYGESDTTTVSANSNTLVDITFPSALTEVPNVYCMARSTVCIECNVEQVTNQQVSIRLYNNTSTDADSVSIDWLAISGR